jgi:TRAP-type C4-dicarboxylate transport system permease small subunit
MSEGDPRKPIVRGIEKAARAVERIAAIPCMAFIGLMTAIVIVGVVFRYFFMNPIGWTEEAARYLMIWAASLAVSMGIMKGEHVGLNFLVDVLPPPIRRLAAIAVNLAILYFLWVLTERGYWMAINGRNQVSSLLGVSMIWSLAAIPAAGLLAMLQTFFLLGLLILSSSQKSGRE